MTKEVCPRPKNPNAEHSEGSVESGYKMARVLGSLNEFFKVKKLPPQKFYFDKEFSKKSRSFLVCH